MPRRGMPDTVVIGAAVAAFVAFTQFRGFRVTEILAEGADALRAEVDPFRAFGRAARGLVGCPAEGPEGINIGSKDIGSFGQDLGDPDATELGEGHEGGNCSPYDDGVWHTAPGHCPAASTVGTGEVVTPLLPAPLKGNIYVARPECGGEGQKECTEASAENGELFGAYLEVSGSGVIVKLKGTLSANPSTGQITAKFTENPQLPFSEVRLHIDGGPRAPFANPQTCGTATTSSSLQPWSETPPALVSSAFEVTGCPAGAMPFAPSFTAGTTSPGRGPVQPVRALVLP